MPRKTASEWRSIELEYRAGVMPVTRIAKRYDVSHPAIFRLAKEEGWHRDPEQMRKKRIGTGLVALDCEEVASARVIETRVQEIIEEEANKDVKDLVLARENYRLMLVLINRALRRIDEDTEGGVPFCARELYQLTQALAKTVDVFLKIRNLKGADRRGITKEDEAILKAWFAQKSEA